MSWAARREEEVVYTACNPEGVGPGTILLSIFPVVVTTALQTEDIRTALIAGTVLAGVVVGLGFILYWISARRIALYMLDAMILIALIVQLGVSYAEKEDIARCFNFIFFSVLAGGAVISMLVGYPFTLQHVRESVPRDAWRHPMVMQTAFFTTAICAATFTINVLIYLVPVAEDVWWDRHDALTIMFQVVLPCVFYVLTVLMVLVAPMHLTTHLQESKGFNQVVGVNNPLAHV